MYDYNLEMKHDVMEYVLENYKPEEINELDEDELNDELWIEDSVTGNGSGSYTFNRWEAERYVKDNFELLNAAVWAFDIDKAEIGEMVLNEDWERADVTIRCYLLGQAISEALEELRTMDIKED